MIYLWLGVMLMALFVEGATAAITSLWFVVGALCAMLAAFLGAQMWLQVVVFAAVSVVCLLALRPILKKYIEPKKVKTNIDALIGAQGVVLERIDNLEGTGRVKLGGMEWSARSSSGEPIEAGTVIRVEKIEGVKVFVKVHSAQCTVHSA